MSEPGGPAEGIHDSAAAGFQAGAEAYERGRPGYPPEGVKALARECGIGPGRRVLDLAAGTGKLTRLLSPLGADLVAVEPVEGMRRAFAERLPGIPILEGMAEAIPAADGSVDAVVVAQAFHWFEPGAALGEIHRVLRSGTGSLGLVWNVRDESVPWVARLSEVFEPYRGTTPSHRSGAWRRGFDQTELFAPLRKLEFRHAQSMTVDGLVDRVLSISFVAALPDDERSGVAERIRELAATDPDLAGRGTFSLPYRTDVYAARVLEPASSP